jgi:hypothetical protein
VGWHELLAADWERAFAFHNQLVGFVLVLFYTRKGFSRRLCAKVPATHPALVAHD